MFFVGALGSAIGSLIGAGGGVVLTPLLTALHLSQHQAHGTSLCVITVTAAISALKYSSRGQVDIMAAVVLSLGAILTSPLGARTSSRLNAPMLKRYFGAFLVLVSLMVPCLPYIGQSAMFTLPLFRQRVLLAVVGMLTGFMSGLLGIGGGTINVPVLVLFAAFPQKLAQGTALLAMVVPSIRASLAHIQLQQVVLRLLPALIVGALIGGIVGSSTALYLPEAKLRIICSVIFAITGIRYLFPRVPKP